MIFTIERAVDTITWLAKISRAVPIPQERDFLFLELVGNHGMATVVVLDEDARVRFLERGVGEFDDPAEIVGKDVVVVLDRLGDIVTFHSPLPLDYDRARYAPPPLGIDKACRTREGLVLCETGIGPKFLFTSADTSHWPAPE